MLDIRTSGLDYPSNPLSFVANSRWLCLAPHPDDEVIGCAGTLMLAHQAGAWVRTVVVCDGAQGLQVGLSHDVREHESRNAAQIMGLPEPGFLGWSDRQLRFNLPLVEQIGALLTEHRPTHLLLPSLAEPHPDHQALALAGTQAALQSNSADDLVLLYYEVGAPSQPNTAVNITGVSEKKWLAMQAFVSQEALHPYARHAQALATLRALGVGPHCQAAEAFWQTRVSVVRSQGWTAALPQWALQRAALNLANEPSQLPLVSVLIRSMSRSTLSDAIASVATQTYPNIEVVLINASGKHHAPIHWSPQRLSLRMVEVGCPLNRSEAANVGLNQAHGELALFLDDDDLIEPLHLENLVAALQGQPHAVAAHTGVRVLGDGGGTIRIYDTPWSSQRLAGINFLPIHGVLFRTAPVRQHALRFNPTLPVLEDWDFWLQLTQYGSMVHVPGVTGIYRQNLGQSMLGQEGHTHYWRNWHRKLLRQEIENADLDQIVDWLEWHAISLDQAETQVKMLMQLRAQHQALVELYGEREAQHLAVSQSFLEMEGKFQAFLQHRWIRWGRRLGLCPPVR